MLDDPPSPRKTGGFGLRPTIWADGGQKPRFDIRAFGRASLHLGREGLAPILTGAASGTAAFGSTVASGKYRVPEDRWGRTGRFLPTYMTVAGWIGGAAAILAKAGQTASVPTTATTPQPAAPFIRPVRPRTKPADGAAQPPLPTPQAPLTDTPASELSGPKPSPDHDPLKAIRADLLPGGDAASPVPPQPGPEALPRPGPVTQALLVGSGRALGWGLIALALPYGAVRATLAHLNGQDLREIGKKS